MTEPPRAPGDGNPPDPAEPLNPYPGNDPTPGSPFPGPPPAGAGGYAPPPSGPPPSGPPFSGPPPSSGAGGYGPPPYGYGPAAGGPLPGGYATEDERTWALIAHFGGAIVAFISSGWLGWVAPLVALLAKGNQSPRVRREAAGALNFQLLWALVALAITVISTCLLIIVIGAFGYLLLVVPWLMGTIFGIVAGVKAVNGEPYRYPGAPNWIK
ncbi:MAG TPA: DUF4870 domain-containing protein [Actinoplanes sp.]